MEVESKTCEQLTTWVYKIISLSLEEDEEESIGSEEVIVVEEEVSMKMWRSRFLPKNLGSQVETILGWKPDHCTIVYKSCDQILSWWL